MIQILRNIRNILYVIINASVSGHDPSMRIREPCVEGFSIAPKSASYVKEWRKGRAASRVGFSGSLRRIQSAVTASLASPSSVERAFSFPLPMAILIFRKIGSSQSRNYAQSGLVSSFLSPSFSFSISIYFLLFLSRPFVITTWAPKFVRLRREASSLFGHRQVRNMLRLLYGARRVISRARCSVDREMLSRWKADSSEQRRGTLGRVKRVLQVKHRRTVNR